MAGFNDRFSDTLKMDENTYNLNGDIYYKGKKIKDREEYQPGLDRKTDKKTGKLKGKENFRNQTEKWKAKPSGAVQRKKTKGKQTGRKIKNKAAAVMVLIFVGIGVFVKNMESVSPGQLENWLRQQLATMQNRGGENPSVKEASNLTLQSDTEVNATRYKQEKKKLDMAKAKTVKDMGEINVCGETFSLDMTVEELKDKSSYCEEQRNQETGELEGMVLYYEGDKGFQDMLHCSFEPKDDIDSGGSENKDTQGNSDYQNYRIMSFYLGHYYTGNDLLRVHYNAKIPYGISTDMKMEKVIQILEKAKKEFELVELPDEELEYPYVSFGRNGIYYTIGFEDERVSDISVFR